METQASSFPSALDNKRKRRIWELLSRSEELDKFLGKKFPNLKRYGELHAASPLRPHLQPPAISHRWRPFASYSTPRVELRTGCEGAESMLPALDTLFELSATSGVTSVVVALPHRGRLSMLCDPSLLAYSPTALFAKIKGQPEFDPATAPGATGDVISHLAARKRIAYDGGAVKVEVLQNPSHLEVSAEDLVDRY